MSSDRFEIHRYKGILHVWRAGNPVASPSPQFTVTYSPEECSDWVTEAAARAAENAARGEPDALDDELPREENDAGPGVESNR